jgi:hypothetical protein
VECPHILEIIGLISGMNMILPGILVAQYSILKIAYSSALMRIQKTVTEMETTVEP